jgi:hypothetical protein
MATGKKQGRVVLRGRFKAGTDVRLVEVAHEGVFRSQGGREVGEATVDEDGVVEFTSGVVVGGRYLLVGYIDGQPVEVRARGNEITEDEAVLGQAPVGYDETRTRAGLPSDAIQGAREDETPADPDDDGVLRGDALHERAAQLDIEGRSSMSADALRASIAEAESKQG